MDLFFRQCLDMWLCLQPLWTVIPSGTLFFQRYLTGDLEVICHLLPTYFYHQKAASLLLNCMHYTQWQSSPMHLNGSYLVSIICVLTVGKTAARLPEKTDIDSSCICHEMPPVELWVQGIPRHYATYISTPLVVIKRLLSSSDSFL